MNRVEESVQNPDRFTAIVTAIPHDEYGFAAGKSETTRYHTARASRGRKLVHVAERAPTGFFHTFCGGWSSVSIKEEVDEPVTCRKCRNLAIRLGIAVAGGEV